MAAKLNVNFRSVFTIEDTSLLPNPEPNFDELDWEMLEQLVVTI